MKNKILIIIGIVSLLLLTGCGNKNLLECKRGFNLKDGTCLQIKDYNNSNLSFIMSQESDFEIDVLMKATPQGIHFNADYINFTDGKINLTFGDDFLNFENYDYIEWNLGNESYIFEKAKANLGDTKDES